MIILLSPQTMWIALVTEAARGFMVSPAGAQFEVTTSQSESFTTVKYPENIGGEALADLRAEELEGFPQLKNTYMPVKSPICYSGHFLSVGTALQVLLCA